MRCYNGNPEIVSESSSADKSSVSPTLICAEGIIPAGLSILVAHLKGVFDEERMHHLDEPDEIPTKE